MEKITEDIANDTHIFLHPFRMLGGSVSGGWTLAMGTDLFERLKNSPAAITVTKKAVNVPWLKWTLEVGNAVVISDFACRFKLGKGRSGFANMIPNKIIGYRIPPHFSGTNYNNWITRDIIPYLDKYVDIIFRTVNRYAP